MKDKKVFFAIGIAIIIIALIIVLATRQKKPEPTINPGESVKEVVEDNTIKDIYGVDLMSNVYSVTVGKLDGEVITNYSAPAFVSEFAGTSFVKSNNVNDFSYNDIKDTEEYMIVYDKDNQPILYMLPIDPDRYFISVEKFDQNTFKDFIYEK